MLDDIGSKLDKTQEQHAHETCRQMAEAISKDGSLNEADKKTLSEKLKELGEAS